MLFKEIAIFALACTSFSCAKHAKASSGLPKLPKLSINITKALTEGNTILHSIPDLTNISLPDINWVAINKTLHSVKVPANIVETLNGFGNGTDITTVGDLVAIFDKIPDNLVDPLLKSISPKLTKDEIVDILKGALYQDTPLQELFDVLTTVQKYDLTKITIADLGQILGSIKDLQQNINAVLNYLGIKLKVDATKIEGMLEKIPISIPIAYSLLQKTLNELKYLTFGEVATLLNAVPATLLKPLGIEGDLNMLKKIAGLIDPQEKVSDLLKVLNALKQYDLRTITVGDLMAAVEVIPDDELSTTVNAFIQALVPGLKLTWDQIKLALEGYSTIKLSALASLL